VDNRYNWLSGDMPESQGEPRPVRSPYENYAPLAGRRREYEKWVDRNQAEETMIHEDGLSERTQREDVTQIVTPTRIDTTDIMPKVRPSAYSEAIAVGQAIQAEDLTAREQILLMAERQFFKNVSWAMSTCLVTAVLMTIFWTYEAVSKTNFVMLGVAVLWALISGAAIYQIHNIWRQYRKLPPR
jgi:hypothetical protein